MKTSMSSQPKKPTPKKAPPKKKAAPKKKIKHNGEKKWA